MQINLSNRLAVLAAVGLAVYGIVALTSRPAEAQVITYPSAFPRHSDLWELRLDPATWTTVERYDGSMIRGYALEVVPDSLNRLPVVTAAPVQISDNAVLMAEVSGKYYYFVQLPNIGASRDGFSFSPGITLRPGRYLVNLNYTNPPGGHAYEVGLIGYWARP